ncbi:MAG: Gfo/Idh/MocA family oxidoreductase [Pseudomonadota bacterium]
MRFAIVGCGFVADYYMTTLENHRSLKLAGVYDVDPKRLTQFSQHYRVHAASSFDDVLAEPSIEAIAVLTTPETHFDLAKAALEAGKHVYCEKPLAMSIEEAKALVRLADQKRLVLGGAPANRFSDAYGATRKLIERGDIGAPKLVYAQMEDGPVFRDNWQTWRSVSGAPWPGKHEFEIGCTLEHSGYALSWLIELFGPIETMTGTSATFFMDKGVDIAPEKMAPDFSTACLIFQSGVVARLTNGLSAPKDRSLTIMGERGTITVDDLWDNRSAIHMSVQGEVPPLGFRVVRRLEAMLGGVLPVKFNEGKRIRYKSSGEKSLPKFPSQIDFCAGIVAVEKAIGDDDARRALAARALHVTEAALALNRISDHGGQYAMKSTL